MVLVVFPDTMKTKKAKPQATAATASDMVTVLRFTADQTACQILTIVLLLITRPRAAAAATAGRAALQKISILSPVAAVMPDQDMVTAMVLRYM